MYYDALYYTIVYYIILYEYCIILYDIVLYYIISFLFCFTYFILYHISHNILWYPGPRLCLERRMRSVTRSKCFRVVQSWCHRRVIGCRNGMPNEQNGKGPGWGWDEKDQWILTEGYMGTNDMLLYIYTYIYIHIYIYI